MEQLVIETKELTKIFAGQQSVSGLNIHVRRGSIYGLLGRNGAGKTTTMKMLLGLLKPTRGKAFIFGKDIEREKKNILPKVGGLIETPGFYSNLTGSENLRLFAAFRGIKDEKILETTLHLVNLEYNDKKIFAHYSLGMKQRLAIALAIMHEPELLILDEPTNGLDPVGISEMRNFIRDLCKEKGITIIVSSHILSEIEVLADDIGIINQGKLLKEERKEILTKERINFIQLQVDNIQAAKQVLHKEYAVKNLKIIEPNKIIIYEINIDIGDLNYDLVKNGIRVEQLFMNEESLEDYFIRITGGTGIA